MKNYSLIMVQNDKNWDDFVEQSPQGNLFCYSLYLSSVSSNYKRFFILHGPYEIKAALVYFESDDGKNIVLNDLVAYSGIMFRIDPNQKKVSSNAEQLKITEFIIETLIHKYKNVELGLSPNFIDTRPFRWYIESLKNVKSTAGISIRYTSYLNLTELINSTDDFQTNLFANMERRRRRYLKDYKKSNLHAVLNEDPSVLLKNYKLTLSQQSKNVSDNKLDCMKKIINNLIKSNSGFLLEIIDESKPVYSIFFGYTQQLAFAIFASGNLEKHNSMAGAAAYWEGLCYIAKNLGIATVDLEGINSPKGGEFKLGFGGDIRPYYEVAL